MAHHPSFLCPICRQFSDLEAAVEVEWPLSQTASPDPTSNTLTSVASNSTSAAAAMSPSTTDTNEDVQLAVLAERLLSEEDLTMSHVFADLSPQQTLTATTSNLLPTEQPPPLPSAAPPPPPSGASSTARPSSIVSSSKSTTLSTSHPSQTLASVRGQSELHLPNGATTSRASISSPMGSSHQIEREMTTADTATSSDAPPGATEVTAATLIMQGTDLGRTPANDLGPFVFDGSIVLNRRV